MKNQILTDKHTDRHKLLAEVENIVADKAVIRVHISRLCKGIKQAVCKQLNRKCNLSCLRLILSEKLFPEVPKGRNRTRVAALLIYAVNASAENI